MEMFKACYLAFIWWRENTCYVFKLKGGEEKREERGECTKWNS